MTDPLLFRVSENDLRDLYAERDRLRAELSSQVSACEKLLAERDKLRRHANALAETLTWVCGPNQIDVLAYHADFKVKP